MPVGVSGSPSRSYIKDSYWIRFAEAIGMNAPDTCSADIGCRPPLNDGAGGFVQSGSASRRCCCLGRDRSAEGLFAVRHLVELVAPLHMPWLLVTANATIHPSSVAARRSSLLLSRRWCNPPCPSTSMVYSKRFLMYSNILRPVSLSVAGLVRT